MSLFVVMPVRNEADRYLTEVVTRALEVSDGRLFVYDDRSEDGTPEIAAGLGAHVWIRPPDAPAFVEHEGRFRQAVWEAFQHEMRPNPGDWILAQDADEKLFGVRDLSKLMLLDTDVLGVKFVHMWSDTEFRVDKAWRPNVSSRLFRYAIGGRFADRRLACGSEPDYVQAAIRSGRVLWDTPLVMQHLGYARDEDKKSKYERYMKLDGGDFHSRLHIESILDPNPSLVVWVGP